MNVSYMHTVYSNCVMHGKGEICVLLQQVMIYRYLWNHFTFLTHSKDFDVCLLRPHQRYEWVIYRGSRVQSLTSPLSGAVVYKI